MEYAIQLILPIAGGLMLGNWLQKTYGVSPLWTVGLGVLGLIMGIRALYQQALREQKLRQTHMPTQPKPKNASKTKIQGTRLSPEKKTPDASKSNLASLHDLYQKLDELPPEDPQDFPPTLDQELNSDDPGPHDKPPETR